MAGYERRRRSPRVPVQFSVLIEEPPPACPARTADLSRHGALLLSPRRYRKGTELLVQNLERRDRARFRVVWEGGQNETGSWQLGIELLEKRLDFWGPEYEKALKADR